MNLKGDDAVAAIVEWVKEEAKRVSSTRHELGKFYFGVSAASMGVIVSLKKLETPLRIDGSVGMALGFLGVSAIVAMVMTKPRRWRLREDTDLFVEHHKHVRHTAIFIWTWFLIWEVGAAAGIYSVLHRVSKTGSTRT
jgi:flagellar motor component MotA